MRKILILLIIVAALVAAGGWAYRSFFAAAQPAQQEQEEFVVRPGTLTAMVNTTGTVLPEKETTLSFKNAGRVAAVPVQEGQTVKAGEVLAQLDTTDLEYAVAQAKLALESAQAQLLRAQHEPASYDIASAEAALGSAKAAYKKLLAGATTEEIRVARANLGQTEASLRQAQQAYDLVADRPDVGMLPQSVQLEQATDAHEVAKANLALTLRGPSEAELAAARANIVQAEATLARLQEGISNEDLLVAQLAVEQAHLSLMQAQRQLEGATLTAPHDGTITTVGIKEGELSGGQPAFVLTDLSQYHIDASVDEIDIGRLAEGQPVAVTLDALPGEALTGRIAQIAETAQLNSGLVTYKVTILLDPGAVPLRAGMTANVDIETERHEDVLLVPNRYIRIDRTTGQAFVDRLVGEQAQPVEIQIGLRDETYSEVLAGLQEGDVAVLVQESSREQLRRAMQMGGPP